MCYNDDNIYYNIINFEILEIWGKALIKWPESVIKRNWIRIKEYY